MNHEKYTFQMRNTPENSLAASILPGKDEEKMIKDVRLTLPSVILSLKLIGPKMMRITVAYLLERNLARKAVNICKASEASNVFDKGIDFFFPEYRNMDSQVRKTVQKTI